MKIKYYLLQDNSVQWFTKLISIDDHENSIIDFIDVPSKINGPFLNSIFERELHFKSREFRNDYYCGWTISKIEAERINALVELYPKYQEYLKLL